MSPKLQVGTRTSELALTQTRSVLKKLNSMGYNAHEYPIITKGDVDKKSLIELSGDGFFTKEIENSLLKKQIDLAVHSAKDLPTMQHKFLPWFAYGDREDSCDILISNREFQDLKPGTRVGTSSPRRKAQLTQSYPHIKIMDIRGNVPTRLEKILNGTVDAIVLAAAGVNRLRLADMIKSNGLSIKKLPFTTAPGQGILAIQGQFEHAHILEKIFNPELNLILKAEKSLLSLFGGGCHLAMGVGIKKQDQYNLNFFLKDTASIHEFDLKEAKLGDLIRNAFLKTLSKKNNYPRVWLTQPLQHQLAVAKRLIENNLTPICWPLIEIQSLYDPQNFSDLDLNKFEGIVFSSQFGAEFFLKEQMLPLDKIRFFAVGMSTAKYFKDLGLNVRVPKVASAKHLAEMLPPTKKPYLLPGTPMTRLAQHLRCKKIPFKILPLYESVSSKSILRTDTPEISDGDKIVLTSPTAVNEFVVECAGNEKLRNLKIYAMGPSTSKTLAEHNIEHISSIESGSWESLISQLKVK